MLTCPHCGHSATIHTPLLIIRPAKIPALLFSPAGEGGGEQDREQAEALVGMSRQHMGADWDDDWLADGLPIVARKDLVTAIDSDSLSRPDEAVDPRVRSALEQVIALLSADGIRVTTPEELQRAIDSRPELKAKLAKVLR